MIAMTRQLLDRGRRAGVPIVYVRVCRPPGHDGLVASDGLLAAVKQAGALIDGNPGAEVVIEPAPAQGDTVVSHRTMSPFVGGNLDAVLRELEVDTVLLAGVATNVIVEEVARGAVNRGWNAIVVADCCAAATRAAHDASIDTLGRLATEIVDLRAAVAMLDAAEEGVS